MRMKVSLPAGCGQGGTQPVVARLRRAHLGVVVDVHQPEPGGVPAGPLEVVDQRPVEVPAQVDPVAQRPAGRVEMVADEGDPGVIGRPGLVRVGAAVLGDVDRRQVGEPRRQAGQGVVEPLGLDRPVQTGPGDGRRLDRYDPDVERGCDRDRRRAPPPRGPGSSSSRRGSPAAPRSPRGPRPGGRRSRSDVPRPRSRRTGSRPASTGSVKSRLTSRSCRRAAARSASLPEAATAGERFSVMPTGSSPLARSAEVASPCPSSRWCAAARAPCPSRRAGRVPALGVAGDGGAVRLVQRDPVWPVVGPARRPRARRTRRNAAPSPGSASRRRPPAPAAGPSGTASRTARCPARAGRRRAGGRSRDPAAGPGRRRSAARAARRPRSGTRDRPAPASRSRSCGQRW